MLERRYLSEAKTIERNVEISEYDDSIRKKPVGSDRATE
jgi:hypothetical protein